MSRFLELFSSLAGAAMARQMALADFLGERSWSVDLNVGQVSFGDDLVCPIQLLGTESYVNDTWLWAWSNPSDIPPPLLETSRQLKEYGEQHQIPELTNSTFPLSQVDGHQLSMLASGLVRKTVYYRGPYESGALYFLILGVPADVFAPSPVERICAVIGQVIETFEVDHRRMAEAFLHEQGFALTTVGSGLHAIRDDGGTLDFAFDDAGRITELNASVAPS